MQSFTVVVVIRNAEEEQLDHNLPAVWQEETRAIVAQKVCEAVDMIIAQAPGGRNVWGADIRIN